MHSAIDLIKETGMLPYLVEQSFHSDLRDIVCYFLWFETVMATCKRIYVR